MILALVEHDGVRPDTLSLEALALGRRLAAGLGVPLEAVIFAAGAGAGGGDGAGARADAVAAQLGAQGVSRVVLVEHDRLDDYAPDAWAASLVQVASARSAGVLLAAATDRGNELLAGAAARLGVPMAANCTDVRPGGRFEVTRQRWGGSLLEDARLDGGVKLLTVAAHAFAADGSAGQGAGATSTGEPAVERFTPSLAAAELRVRIVERVPRDPGTVSLADARVVVGGGRGVGSAEGFAILEELARLLGGAVGVSRVVTSAGWRPHAEQVGQTGQRIAPELYIACGISGAIQHMVGAKSAKRILAINTDRDAPMVSKATYAVIGDLHAVVPALNAEVRRVTGR